MSEPKTDRELVQAIYAGSQEALLHLVADRCGDSLRHLERRYQFDGDLMHDLIVHLFGAGDWQRLRSWDGSGELCSWIRRIAVRLCIDQFRNNVKQTRRIERLFAESPRHEGVAP